MSHRKDSYGPTAYRTSYSDKSKYDSLYTNDGFSRYRHKSSYASEKPIRQPEKSTSKRQKRDVSKKPESETNSKKKVSVRPQNETGIVFLSKKQREQLVKEEEEKLKQAEREREEAVLKHRKQYMSQDPKMTSGNTKSVSTTSKSDTRKISFRDADTSTRNTDKAENVSDKPTKPQCEKLLPYDETTQSTLSKLKLLNIKNTEITNNQNEKLLEQIRQHYLGLKKESKKLQKPSEKFRNIFNFEWNSIEDTTRGDSNTLYLSRVEPQLLFGRGFRAGIDVREQRKYNNFYDELIKHRTQVGGEQITAIADRELLIKQRDLDTGNASKRHWCEKKYEEMQDRDWRIFREDYEIYIKGGRVPPPMRCWEESNLPPALIEAIKKVGYEKPTPIQLQAIPIALEMRDLIGIAETGSGKTAAFVLPMVTYVGSLPALTDETSQSGPYALVLAPSRELAIQIEEEVQKFSQVIVCRAVAVVGGRSAEAQAFELRKGAEIVIGTPGRIRDCLERAYTVLSQCNYVILDEADRMIDMGFEEVVNWILDQIPSTNFKSLDENLALQQELETKAGYRKFRLTQMFSATMPAAVERLARKYLRSPAYISIGDPGAGKRAIEQRLEFITESRKRQRLQEILETADPPIIVFVNQKKAADVLAKTLYKMGFSATSLHGGKAQDTREMSLNEFKKGNVDILVATDVAGRGIDIEGVQLVINFDMPKDIRNYTHRIGRTGRAGRKGTAISFCTEDDSGLYYDLKQLLISTNNVVPMELQNHPAAKSKAEQAAMAGGEGNMIMRAPMRF